MLKAGACLIQVHLYLFVSIGNRDTGLLIQVACLKEMVTKTYFTVVVSRRSTFFLRRIYKKVNRKAQEEPQTEVAANSEKNVNAQNLLAKMESKIDQV